MRPTPLTYWRRRLTVGAVATALVLAVAPLLPDAAAADPANPGPCTIEWDGGAGTSQWTDGANWAGDRLPGSDDVVCVRASVAGNAGVRVAGGDHVVAALASDTWLHVDGGRLQLLGLSQGLGVEVHGGELDVEWSYDVSDATQDGGVVGGAGAFRVAGFFRWEGGAQVGPGWTGVFADEVAGGGLVLDSEAARAAVGRAIEVPAGMAWSGGGTLDLDAASTLHLAGSSGVEGTAVVTGDGEILVDGQLVVRNGSLDVDARFRTTSDLFVEVQGAGSVLSLTGDGEHHAAYHVEAGAALDLRDGTHDFESDSIVTSASGPEDGEMVIAGADVSVGGRYDVAATTMLDGYLALGDQAATGTLRVLGGELEVDGTVTTTVFGQDGGEVTGDGTLRVEGDAEWAAGSQTGAGSTTVDGELLVSGTVDRALTDRELKADVVDLDDGAQVTITGTTAVLHAETELAVEAGSATLAGTGGYVSAGTTTVGEDAALRVAGRFASFDGAHVNVAAGGFLDLVGGGTHRGSFELAAGAGVNLGGVTVFEADSSVTGDATVGVYEDGLVTLDGVFHADALHSAGDVVVQGGETSFATEVVNHGRLHVEDLSTLAIGGDGAGRFASVDPSAIVVLDGPQAVLDVNGGLVDLDEGALDGDGIVLGDVRNDGGVNAGTTLVVDGDYTQTPLGVLVVPVDGDTTGELEVTGSAALDGILAVDLHGAAPSGPFVVLDAATRSGQFGSLIGIDGACARLDYDAGDVTVVPQPCLTVGSATVGEGDGTITFHVGLTEPSADDVTVDFATVDGTATAGADYEARAGTLTIPAGATEAEITTAVLDDEEEEPEEQFTVSVAVRGATAAQRTATGTVVDDDSEEEELDLPIGEVVTQGDFDSPTGINDTHVVGVSGFFQSDEEAGWAYGFVSDNFGYLPGMVAAYDVNDDNHVVGICDAGPCFRADRVNHPVQGGSPSGLNDDDVLVGTMADPAGPPPGEQQARGAAAIWPTPDGSPTMLPAVPGDWSDAIDIGDDGTVLGVSGTRTSMTAWVVADGATVEIPRVDDLPIMDPRAINDVGVVVGIASSLDRQVNRAWMWSAETGTVDLGPGAALGLNNRGDIVGAGTDSRGIWWQADGDVVQLTDVITDDDWVVGRANLINDDGVIVAQGFRSGGHGVVVLGAPAVDGCDVCIELEPQSARFPNPDEWTGTGSEVVEGNPARLHVALENTDDEVRTATVELRVDDQLVGEPHTVTLDPGERHEIDEPWDLTGGAWVGDQPAPARRITATLLDEDGDEDRTLSAEVAVVPRPVVLVHGMNSDASTWDAYPAMLAAAHPGWEGHAIDTMDTKPWTPNTIAENAALLAQYIDSVQVQSNAWQVDVVAHSMGGLITRQYIEASMPTPAGRNALAHLVMLGTPNAGSPCADLFSIPLTYELRTDVVARFNQRIPDTRGVPASVAVGVHVPFTCDVPVTGDDVVPVESATTGFPDHQLFEIAHTAMTSSTTLFRQFVLPRLTGSAAAATFSARMSGPAVAAATADGSGAPVAPQLLTQDTLTLEPGASIRLEQPLTAGFSGFGATAFAGGSISLAIERNGAELASTGVDPDLPGSFRSVSVSAPASGRYFVVVTNTGATVATVPVTAWVTGAATRLEATAVQEGALGVLRITARLTGTVPAVPPTRFVAEVVRPSGEILLGAMQPAGDGTFVATFKELGVGGHAVVVRSDDPTFRRSTIASAEISFGPDTPGNDAPTAHPVEVAARRDVTTNFQLAGTDPDGDELVYQVVTGPAHGRLGGVGRFLQYVPERGYVGTDSFTYVVSDGELTSPPATVSITVGPSPSTLSYLSPLPAEGQLGQTVEIRANVVGPLLDGPTGGRMTFRLGDQEVVSQTDRGSAGARFELTTPGAQTLTISFAGTGEFAPATLTRTFTVLGGTAPVPTFDGDTVEDGTLAAEAGYPVRVLVRGGDVDANELRYEIDFTDDGTFDAVVTKPTGASALERRSAIFDHSYPAAFTGRLRVRVTDTAGLVGEATLPVSIAAHRPLGALRRLVDGAAERIDGVDVSADGSVVLYQATDNEGQLSLPIPYGVLDRVGGGTELVSVLPDGTVYGFPIGGALSADGSTVAFGTLVGVEGPPSASQVYVRRVDEDVTVVASVGPNGELGDGASYPEAISGDGRYLLFSSRARNLVDVTTTGVQLYLRDLEAGTTTLVSASADGTPVGTGHDAALSRDGRVVVYQQGNAVRLWDRTTGRTERLGVGIGGADPDAPGDAGAEFFDLSASGRYVVFSSEAANLVPGDTNGRTDVFRFDRTTGTTTLISVDRDGGFGNGLSAFGVISADGDEVAFASGATDLVDGDGNGVSDVFVRDVDAGTTTRLSVEARDGIEGDQASIDPQMSDDGRIVIFDSDATALVPGDVNSSRDLFAFDRGPRDTDPEEPTTTTTSTSSTSTTSTTVPDSTTSTTSTTEPEPTTSTSTTVPDSSSTSTTEQPTTSTSAPAPTSSTTSTTQPTSSTTTSTSTSTTVLATTTTQPPTSTTVPPEPGTPPTVPPVRGADSPGPNRPPVATGDTFSATTGEVLEVGAPGLLGNDADDDGDRLTAMLAVEPAHGDVVLAADGSFSYRSAAGFVGTDAFSYTATDGEASSAPITVTIDVRRPTTAVAGTALPRTGTDTGDATRLGLLLLLGGVAILVVVSGRRRRRPGCDAG